MLSRLIKRSKRPELINIVIELLLQIIDYITKYKYVLKAKIVSTLKKQYNMTNMIKLTDVKKNICLVLGYVLDICMLTRENSN